jgi:hypothetical protein
MDIWTWILLIVLDDTVTSDERLRGRCTHVKCWGPFWVLTWGHRWSIKYVLNHFNNTGPIFPLKSVSQLGNYQRDFFFFNSLILLHSFSTHFLSSQLLSSIYLPRSSFYWTIVSTFQTTISSHLLSFFFFIWTLNFLSTFCHLLISLFSFFFGLNQRPHHIPHSHNLCFC